MRQIVFTLLACLFLAACDSSKSSKTPVEYVNPFVGTGGHGHTFPGATLPFGMVQLSPDTRLSGWDGCGGYHYTDSIIYGFSHTHLQGTGISDYGDILIMPTGNKFELFNQKEEGSTEGYCASFNKSTEKASPGYYCVELNNPKVQVELTATLRTGIHKYQFREEGDQYLSIDLEHRDRLINWSFSKVSDTEIQGHRVSKEWAQEQHLYFVAQFSEPIAEMFQVDAGKILSPDTSKKAIFSLNFGNIKELIVKVGISAVDINGAKKNLQAEAQSNDFETYRKAASEEWQMELSKIEIDGGTEEERSIFYTSLYHSFVAPNLFSDTDGRYRGTDMAVHDSPGHPVYTVFSLWDTFRSAHPLFSLVQRERNQDFVKTFLLQYQQGGELPMWELAANETHCMIGYHSAPVILDAWVTGLRAFDTKLALEGMMEAAKRDELGKTHFSEQGFISMEDEAESVSKSLEYAYDDWCIARFAELTGQEEYSERFYARSQFYRNLFDSQTGFMRPRRNGGWASPFDPSEVNFNYTEANSWQYSFFVPHDVPGLIALHGGAAAFEAKLDSLFNASSELKGRGQPDITGMIGQYAHGNEPSHHMAYLYHYTGNPNKSSEMVHTILNTQYSINPDGLSGNEDCGQMSAWYVLSSIGMYPVCPGSGEYFLVKTIFDNIRIKIDNDNILNIKSNGDLSAIKLLQLNGEKRSSVILHWDEIKKNSLLEINNEKDNNNEMNWFIPEVQTTEYSTSACPAIISNTQVFTDSLLIELKHCNAKSELFFRSPGGEWEKYNSAFYIYNDAIIESYGKELDRTESQIVKAAFFKLDHLWQVSVSDPFDPQYNAGGIQGLVDRLKGGTEFRNGMWQGYYGKDFEAVIDLGAIQNVNEICSGFLQDIRPWIWFPKRVIYEYSVDGSKYKKCAEVLNTEAINDYTALRKEFSATFNVKARYIKIKAENFGLIPEWHLGSGNPSWIFVDEISIK